MKQLREWMIRYGSYVLNNSPNTFYILHDGLMNWAELIINFVISEVSQEKIPATYMYLFNQGSKSLHSHKAQTIVRYKSNQIPQHGKRLQTIISVSVLFDTLLFKTMIFLSNYWKKFRRCNDVGVQFYEMWNRNTAFNTRRPSHWSRKKCYEFGKIVPKIQLM